MADDKTKIEKGDAFELAARNILQHIYEHLDITSFDWRTPGYQSMKGKVGTFKCDIVGYKADGHVVIFSCKFRGDSSAKHTDVGELFLWITDLGADGYLVVNKDPSGSPAQCLDEYTAGTIVLEQGATLDDWFACINGLIKKVFRGFGETVPVHDELRTFATATENE